jgi:hypothetical protein
MKRTFSEESIEDKLSRLASENPVSGFKAKLELRKKLKKMKRTFSDILKEADKAKDVESIIDLWNEIAINKLDYELEELFFATEHIRKLVLKSEGDYGKKNRFIAALDSMGH